MVNVKVECLCRGPGNYERRLATALKDGGYETVTKGGSVLFSAMKVVCWSGDVAPCILNLRTRNCVGLWTDIMNILMTKPFVWRSNLCP